MGRSEDDFELGWNGKFIPAIRRRTRNSELSVVETVSVGSFRSSLWGEVIIVILLEKIFMDRRRDNWRNPLRATVRPETVVREVWCIPKRNSQFPETGKLYKYDFSRVFVPVLDMKWNRGPRSPRR